MMADENEAAKKRAKNTLTGTRDANTNGFFAHHIFQK
jgi:hypothetical protein